MRPIQRDDGTRYDDVNARWGDGGSYLSESGDPGNVNTAPDTPGGGSAKKKETKTMKQRLSAGAAEIKKSGASFFRTFPMPSLRLLSGIKAPEDLRRRRGF
jgi:hypothetical protein